MLIFISFYTNHDSIRLSFWFVLFRLFSSNVFKRRANPNAAGLVLLENWNIFSIFRNKKTATTTQSTGPVPETAAIAHDSLMAKPLLRMRQKMLNFRSDTGVSKLTATEEQKVVEKPNGKKIQFADKMVKSTITPGAKK
ncbi:hypothetical protein CRE_21643 [Caenorhabditis remanei]|uniref:Uncharacterized protein n=1 Tax=Caenorhabditis remanei TaxID=31234 RepID=E3NNX9_CAERE|nr:hypothetical protein CRE_21643 [Caenorhabditis remanei]